MTDKTYDLLVLGGGTAGTAAARTAHEAGARVAMFNDGELGGLCILRGCMPTKTMLHAAHLLHELEHPATPGVRSTGFELDFAAVMANKDAKVARFKRAKVEGIEAGGYDVIDARARFVGPDVVEAGGETYRFTRGAVIATGSVPVAPPFEGVGEVRVLSSDDVMRMTEPPRSLGVVGTGAIGLELAQFFARVGTEVQLFSRTPVGSKVDPDIAAEMARFLRDEPRLTLHDGVCPYRLEPTDAGGVRILSSDVEVEVDAFLAATGRAPDVLGLGLDAAGVDAGPEGLRIRSGPDLRTTNPHVFVAGDVTGERQLLHVANWEGALAAWNALELGEPRMVERRLDMEVVFTDPPLATLGATQAGAEAAGRSVVTSVLRFPETGRAITMDVAHGVSKLVADAETAELLGAQVLGPRADDLVHVLSAILYHRGTAHDMLRMPWYHPTLSEVFLSQARELAARADS